MPKESLTDLIRRLYEEVPDGIDRGTEFISDDLLRMTLEDHRAVVARSVQRWTGENLQTIFYTESVLTDLAGNPLESLTVYQGENGCVVRVNQRAIGDIVFFGSGVEKVLVPRVREFFLAQAQ